jgi:hypothetical protein
VVGAKGELTETPCGPLQRGHGLRKSAQSGGRVGSLAERGISRLRSFLLPLFTNVVEGKFSEVCPEGKGRSGCACCPLGVYPSRRLWPS